MSYKKLTTNSPDNLSKRIHWSQFFVNVVFSIASIVAVIQYFSFKEDTRIKHTMDQLAMFSNSEHIKARQELHIAFEGTARPSFSQNWNSRSVKKEEDNEELLITIVRLAHDYYPNLYLSTELIINFYWNLKICVEYKICDRKLTASIFCGKVSSFSKLYSPWLKSQDKESFPLGKSGMLGESVKIICLKDQ